MMHESLPQTLRVLRARRGWTLVEAAGRAGVGRDTLSDLERGRQHPSVPTLTKLAKGYGVPVEELLEEPVLAGKAEASEPRPSASGVHHGVTDVGEEARDESWPKTVAEARAKFLPIAAILEDYCRAYEQLSERTVLNEEDVRAFVHTAVELKDYHKAALEGELVDLSYAMGRKLSQKEQLGDLSVLRPAFNRYFKLMRDLVERLPAGAEKRTLVKLATGDAS